MILAIAASPEQRESFEKKGIANAIKIIWVSTSGELYAQLIADAWIDCLFDGGLTTPPIRPLLINSTVNTIYEMPPAFNIARFCGWNGFIERPTWEMCVSEGHNASWLEELMQQTGWNYVLVKDAPGFIAARIISMIVNEAYFALSENISSREEIDIAMKLGTNYPSGPFAWADTIGLKHIITLLHKLSETDKRYTPCTLLRDTAVS